MGYNMLDLQMVYAMVALRVIRFKGVQLNLILGIISN